MHKIGIKAVKLHKFRDKEQELVDDLLVVEEPLEIRIRYGTSNERKELNLAITMRTPGNDFELAKGFLMTEGIVSSNEEIVSVQYCVNPKSNEEVENIVKIELAPHVIINPSHFQRNFYISSSCGVCGKSSIEAAMIHCKPIEPNSSKIESKLLKLLPEQLRNLQIHFKHTGGLHACAFFDTMGQIELIREDVGRHNALDKLIGAHYSIKKQAPFGLLLSGRISFELVQKASMAGVSLIAAIGAPSSLAVEMAQNNQITLVGFLKAEQFNCYTFPERIA
jgi:FdhD protein